MRASIRTSLSVLALTFVAVSCEDEGDQHGFVTLEFIVGSGGDVSVFQGTKFVEVTATYDGCLMGFYQAHPEYGVIGTKGGEIFEDWKTKLCDTGVPGQATCQVVEFIQFAEVPLFRVRYDLLDGGIAYQKLGYGPLPQESLAGCTASMQFSPGGFVGFDAAGAVLWYGESLSDNTAPIDNRRTLKVAAARPS